MATAAEMTAQIVGLHQEVANLTARVQVAEKNVAYQQQQQQQQVAQVRSGGSEHGVFDKKRLYLWDFEESSYFATWAERFISWLMMDDAEIGTAFARVM